MRESPGGRTGEGCAHLPRAAPAGARPHARLCNASPTRTQPLPAFAAKAASALMSRGWLLLTFTSLFWSGNVVAGRLAVGQISPMALTCLRWMLVSALLLAWQGGELRRQWPLLRANWTKVAWMGGLGYTGYNALFYAGAHYTTGINMAIIQGAMPVMILLGSMALGRRVTPVQWVGLALTTLGVMVVATQGEFARLLALALNRGDLMMLLACLFYGAYTIDLPNRPKVTPLVFMAALGLVACVTSVPLLVAEVARGDAFWPTPAGWLIVLYVGIFPSLLAQVFFMRGVELIGPARAGLFTNLVPVIGALLVVAILHEPFGAYHAVALALVMGGLWVTERLGRR